MNVFIKMAAPDAGYERDIVLWADHQARLLREGRFDEADIPNIVEEIESLARSERSALGSQIGRVIEHLLKLRYSPARDPRRGWIESILDARRQIDRILSDSPSLQPALPTIISAELSRTRQYVSKSLRLYEEAAAAIAVERDDLAFTVEQITGDWFPGD